MAETVPKLFQPIRVGNLTLGHRVTLAPLTRFRASDAHVPTDLMVDYYAQRASVPGTLLITEATFIAAQAGGMNNVPGIWSPEQVEGWKKVTEAVHARGSYIFMQLWALGRAADSNIITAPDSISNPGGPYPYVSASDVQLSGRPIPPRALSDAEILEYVELYTQAAKNAVLGAGFDGVEVHGAHGYLLDQFIQDVTNKRTDDWGGSIDKRSRFPLQVLKSVIDAVGEERTAIRLSLFSTFQGTLSVLCLFFATIVACLTSFFLDMRMDDPYPTFTYLVTQIRQLYPRFAYLHVVEPRVAAGMDREPLPGESNDFIRAIWTVPGSKENGSVLMSAGAYNRQLALQVAEEKDELIAFGRPFIPNVST